MQIHQGTALETYAHLMLEHQPVGTALFEASTFRLLAANTHYQSLLPQEWQQERAIGHCLPEFVPGIEQTDILAICQQVRETGVSCCMEAYAFAAGSMRYWNWTLTPISEAGQVNYLLLTLTEVTREVVARKLAEQARQATLEETHETVVQEWQRLEYVETILTSLRTPSGTRALAQAVCEAVHLCFSGAAVALYSPHPHAGILTLLASHPHEDALQETAVLGASVSSVRERDLFAALEQRVPLIRHLCSESEPNSLSKQEAQGSETQCLVYVPLWTQQCEGVLLVALSPSQTVGEQLVSSTLSECAPHVAEALSDARHQAALLDERQRLHLVLDQLPEGIVIVEARTGNIRYANQTAAHLLGSERNHLLGTPLNQSALLSPYGLSSRHQQSAFRWNFALIDALWGKRVTNQEIVIPRPDGSEIIVLSSAAPIRDSGGKITEAVLVFQDITDLKALEQQKNEFFAVANHELRTPLTVIIGFAELLQLYLPEGADALYEHAVTNLTKESEHLSQLLGELLDVSRLEQAQLDLNKRYQDVLAPLTQLVNQQMQASRTHQLHLTLEDLSASDTLMGWVDLRRIEQVLRNLLSNAIKYSPAGGDIQVGIRPRRGASGKAEEVLIWVADQGMGIAARDLPHIFERFYRADGLEMSISGFGIGLYLSKQLVQGHGGRIWVESTLGRGSTFFFTFPLEQPL